MQYSIILAIVALASSYAVFADAATIQRRDTIPEGGQCNETNWKNCKEGTRCVVQQSSVVMGGGSTVLLSIYYIVALQLNDLYSRLIRCNR
ncbi:hypothetical protein BDF22DRAFT_685253 [Syncephalis plumigaleata]|nr:hypothetical protein BDF22DRAFT_685253 [Syncephalis plumigaleata]